LMFRLRLRRSSSFIKHCEAFQHRRPGMPTSPTDPLKPKRALNGPPDASLLSRALSAPNRAWMAHPPSW